MATLTIPNTFNNGEVIDAPEMNSNFTAVKNFVEGMSAGNNFDVGAINTTDIADSAITAAKLASASVTTAKLASSLTLTTPDIGAALATSISCSGQVTDHPSTNEQVSSYTLVLTDDGKIVELNLGLANTVTIPLNSSVNFPIGTKITVLQTGAGQTTIAATSGVTLNGTPGLKLRAQWSAATLLKRGTDSWVAMGDLSS